jgi:amino acid transporter
MILDKLMDYSKRMYKRFFVISFLALLLIFVSVYLGLAVFTGIVLSVLVLVLVLVFIFVFYFSVKKMTHYHLKSIEIWDEKISKVIDNKSSL